MNLLRIVGLFVAVPLVAFGLFLLLRGDPGDGLIGPLVVGLTALGIGLLVLAVTFVGGNPRVSPVVLLVIVAQTAWAS